MRGAVDGIEVIVGNLAMLGEAGVAVPEAARPLAVDETERGRIEVYASCGACSAAASRGRHPRSR
jgi:hypothetical protein